jgi:hypothetical protein
MLDRSPFFYTLVSCSSWFDSFDPFNFFDLDTSRSRRFSPYKFSDLRSAGLACALP